MNEQTLTPCINITGAAKAIEFYQKVFGATVEFRDDGENGFVNHANLIIGTSRLMLCDEVKEIGALSPITVGGCPFMLLVTVPDADKAVEEAVKEGATILHPVKDQEWGSRSGAIRDPFGFRWSVATAK